MKTTARMYDSYAKAQSTVADLRGAGIANENISLIANRDLIDAEIIDSANRDVSTDATTSGAVGGAAIGGGVGLLAGLGMLAVPALGPVVALGWVASAAAGALGGAMAGGIVGALVDAGMSEDDANLYSEAVRRGDIVVTARHDDSQSEMVRTIMDRNGAIDTDSRRTAFERDGWMSRQTAPA